MNATKNVTTQQLNPKNEVLMSIRSFARSYQHKSSKKFKRYLEWVEN
ncbi:MAG: hypothetical protein VX710_03680 [Bacteroidota bacterium]|nr:hypothetical protein [Bacteroidota bacterium]